MRRDTETPQANLSAPVVFAAPAAVEVTASVERPVVSSVPYEPAAAAVELHSQLIRVLSPVMARGNHRHLELADMVDAPLGKKIARKVERKQKLVFLLPAFPAKSSNLTKTSGAAPDLGEFLGLQTLEAMCAEISAAYAPGAEVLICSDGRVFNDLVMVSDEDLAAYAAKIDEMIERHAFDHLKTFSLDDCSHLFSEERMREELVEQFGPEISAIREGAKADPHRRAMLNGIHRFVKDDLAYTLSDLSKNQISIRSKKISYQVVQRSQSWDNLLETIFPEALRLSIHPYPVTHKKFGIKLVPGGGSWATPWHNVVVKEGSSYRLMKRREALDLGASLQFQDGEYAYYEII